MLYLPQYVATADALLSDDHEIKIRRRIEAYLHRCTAYTRKVFENTKESRATPSSPVADRIIQTFLHRDFNYQSKGKVAHLVPILIERVTQFMREQRPLPVYLLYHGGYRAATGTDRSDLVFSPDATELLLLYQIARLQEQIKSLYMPGLAFHIVINDGVAAYVNDIPLTRTRHYSDALRVLVRTLGSESVVTVLTQSSCAHMDRPPVTPVAPIPVDRTAHDVIERFLGRTCSPEEAGQRAARYIAAETAWGQTVDRIIGETSGFYLRQISHPACLSFRPFPGGAIRVQNGSIGFRVNDDDLVDPTPLLVTSHTRRQNPVMSVPVSLTSILSPAVMPERAMA